MPPRPRGRVIAPVVAIVLLFAVLGGAFMASRWLRTEAPPMVVVVEGSFHLRDERSGCALGAPGGVIMVVYDLRNLDEAAVRATVGYRLDNASAGAAIHDLPPLETVGVEDPLSVSDCGPHWVEVAILDVERR
jgi:hypothetical protein